MGKPAQERKPCKCRDRRGHENCGEIINKPLDKIHYILHTNPPNKRHVEYSKIAKIAAEVSHT